MYEEMVIAFMASQRGLDTALLAEDQEYELLMEFNDTEEFQRDFRIKL